MEGQLLGRWGWLSGGRSRRRLSGSQRKSKDSDAMGRRHGGFVCRQSPHNSQEETLTK